MPAPTTCLLLIDPPADGSWNMAVDEVLLSAVAISGRPALRFYRWKSPTLSLGYFQSYSERSKHPTSLAAKTVRRLSGGGAILHDQELTYSLILPASHALARDTQLLYNTVHQTIAAVLNHLLAEAQSPWQAILCKHPSALAMQDEPFLCFQRRSKGDILLDQKSTAPESLQHKVVGSAQRRRQGTVLQHGSILLSQSQLTPELPGIRDASQLKLSVVDFLTDLSKRLQKKLCLEFEEGKLTDQLSEQAEQLQRTKYQAVSWTERR